MPTFRLSLLALTLVAGLAPAVHAQPPYPPVPELRPEPIPPPPGRQYVWEPGHYRWDGARYIWDRGRYVPRRAYGRYAAYVPGHWGDRRGVPVWIPAHWR